MGTTKDKLLQVNASSQEPVKVEKKPALLATEQKTPAEERLNMEAEQRTAPESKETESTIIVDQSKADSNFLPLSKGEKVVLPEGQKKRMSHAEMYEELNASKMPTQAELENEQKRRKRNALLSAVGDGISALANVYFTSKGAPEVRYDRSASLSARNKARWDKMDQQRDANMKAYAVGMMQAKDKDLQQEISDKRFKEQMKQQSELAKLRAENERYEADMRLALEAQKRAHEADENEEKRAWQTAENDKKIEADKEQKALDRQNRRETAEIRKNTSSTESSASKNRLPFSNGKNLTYNIDKNVWSANGGNVLEALREDGFEMKNEYIASASDKEAFIKTNWHKSPKAIALMEYYSKIDPTEGQSNGKKSAGSFTKKANNNSNEKKISNIKE